STRARCSGRYGHHEYRNGIVAFRIETRYGRSTYRTELSRFDSKEPRAVSATATPTAPPDPRRWWTLGVLCLSLIVISLDNTILNVALPTLERDLGASSSQLQWIVDAYMLVFAGLLLTAGALGDRFGRRRALTFGLFVFGAGSALSATAT